MSKYKTYVYINIRKRSLTLYVYVYVCYVFIRNKTFLHTRTPLPITTQKGNVPYLTQNDILNLFADRRREADPSVYLQVSTVSRNPSESDFLR